jgi:hypothetical protein
MIKKLPISAIVVGYNEGHLLSNCFDGISFCDEILYFDLGSVDDSIEIAKKHNVTIIRHEKVSIVEIIHAKYYEKTKNKWVLITDPDEVISQYLKSEIHELFSSEISGEIGAIVAPLIYFFKKHRLNGTNWGGVNSRVLLIHNERFRFSNSVHFGRKLKEGFSTKTIEFTEKNFIYHFWMQSYNMLYEKHKRYLQHEGEARFLSGHRTQIKSIISSPFVSFLDSFYFKKGYRDGFIGLFLSLFWSWYQTRALIELYRFEKMTNS